MRGKTKYSIKNNNGITLIALVVTIIVLIILAGISINLVLGENGIIQKAKEAKKVQEIASVTEQVRLDLVSKQLNGYIELTDAQVEGVLSKYGTVNKNTDGSIKSLTTKENEYEIPFEDIWKDKIVESFDKTKNVNMPVLVSGMTPIKFTMPTESAMGEVIKTNTTDAEWYNYGETYETKKWANAQTQDGSMWVWIPRYAYKITGQTIDVKFLIGQTDTYYKDDGTIGTAQRQTEENQTIDSTADYTVHPAFTDESAINFANGGWDSELTGIWVAKFEAGYASGNNDAPVKASNVNYTQKTVWVANVEAGTSNADGGATIAARNWLDGIYGETDTSIKYPVFQGTTYGMNYISHNDSYNIAKALNDTGNIYGFSNTNTDSHLMKNSEWGAVAYLSKSVYGQNEKEIAVNNITLNSGSKARTETVGKIGVDSVYAVTGCTTGLINVGGKVTTTATINNLIGNENTDGIYVWNQLTGQKASTTGTIYGVYDISGGTWESTTSYVANGNNSLKDYGELIAYENNTLKTKSTKYTIVYPYSWPESSTINIASRANFANNTQIYGDSVRETTSSNAGTGNAGWEVSSWSGDYSQFPAFNAPFFVRGGDYWTQGGAGTFAFVAHNGDAQYNVGFRAVVIPTI